MSKFDHASLIEEMHTLGYSVKAPCVCATTSNGMLKDGGDTAYFAVHENNVYVLEALHKCGVDLSQKCDGGEGQTNRTPKELAQHTARESCVAFLDRILAS